MNECQKRGHSKLFITCQECHQVINQATFKDPNQWISVKERMPKMGESLRNEVLTWDGKEMTVRIPSFYNDGTATFFQFSGDPEITHWMPLPEPPTLLPEQTKK